MKKVFSKDKWIENIGKEMYLLQKKFVEKENGFKFWVDECDGLTEEEMKEIGYSCMKEWLVNK